MSAAPRRPLLADAKLFEISPDHVDEGERIGFLHEDKAAAIGRLMAVDGQRDAIKVIANTGNADKPWKLVTGMHRLVGARIEGITLWAIEVHGTLEELADLEASENKHRRTLNPIEDAKFIATLVDAAQKRIARERGGLRQQQVAIRARWAKVKAGEQKAEGALRDEVEDTLSNFATAYGTTAGSWEKDVGHALGMGRDAIYRALRIYRLIVLPFPALVEPLSQHPVVGNNAKQLREIADIADEQARREVIAQIIADPELSADEAKLQAGIGLSDGPSAPPPPHKKHYNAIEGAWGRLGLGERRAFVPTIVAMMNTPGLKRELRDLLNKELGDE